MFRLIILLLKPSSFNLQLFYRQCDVYFHNLLVWFIPFFPLQMKYSQWATTQVQIIREAFLLNSFPSECIFAYCDRKVLLQLHQPAGRVSEVHLICLDACVQTCEAENCTKDGQKLFYSQLLHRYLLWVWLNSKIDEHHLKAEAEVHKPL